MRQLSQTTQQNASSSEELAATSEEMSSQAEQLQQTMSFFKLGRTAPKAKPVPVAEPRKPALTKPVSKTVAKTTPARRPAGGFHLAGGMALTAADAGDESPFVKF